MYLDILGTIFQLWGTWLIGRKRALGWGLSILGDLLWVVEMVYGGMYSTALCCVVFMVLHAWNWWKWRDEEEYKKLCDSFFSP